MHGKKYLLLILSTLIFNVTLFFQIYSLPKENIEIRSNIFVRGGYILIRNDILFSDNVLSKLTYNLGGVIKENLLYIGVFHGSLEMNFTRDNNEVKIFNPELYKNISIYMIFYNIFNLNRRRGEFNLTIPLLSKEMDSALCHIIVKNEIDGNLTLINSTMPLNYTFNEWYGNFIVNNSLNSFSMHFSINSYRGGWLWLICENVTREIIIDNYNSATFIDHLVITNIGNVRSSRVVLKLPPNAVLKNIKGVIGEYHEGRGYGKYSISRTNVSLNIELYLYSPPHRGEKAYIDITYTLPLNESNGKSLLDVFYNPNIFVKSSRIIIKALGRIDIKEYNKLNKYAKNGYEMIEFLNKIPLCNDIPLTTSIYFNVEINQFYKYWRYINLTIVAIIAVSIIYIGQRSIGKKVKRVERKIVKAEALPSMQKLHDEYIEKVEMLERLLDLRRKYFRRKVSKYIYRQGLKRYRSQVENIDKKINKYEKILISQASIYRELIEDISNGFRKLNEKIEEIIKVEQDKRLGRLTSKEYADRITMLEEEYDKLKTKLLDKISDLSEE